MEIVAAVVLELHCALGALVVNGDFCAKVAAKGGFGGADVRGIHIGGRWGGGGARGAGCFVLCGVGRRAEELGATFFCGTHREVVAQDGVGHAALQQGIFQR